MTNKDVYANAKKLKLLAICGSPRKGNTYRALTVIRDSFPRIDFEILQLNDMEFNFCKGCYSCVLRGEAKCPIKDDRDMILSRISEADGLILASPVYSHMVSALMKNFFDRFGYLAHRPQFFDKYAMSMVTCSGYGAEDALKYMNKMLSVFGFNLAPSLELQIQPGTISDETIARNRQKSILAVETLVDKIEKGKRDDPSLGLMIPFLVFKYVSKLDKDLMPADFEYYKDKGDYYYDTKIPYYKKFIAKRVSDKIISQFD
jgi:multimeric flavodoxin WrbA